MFTHFDALLQIMQYYSEPHHVKGPVMGCDQRFANRVAFTDVKSNKCIINSTEEFASYTNQMNDSITSQYLSANQAMHKQESVPLAQKILETLKLNENSPQPKFLFLNAFIWCQMKNLFSHKSMLKIVATCAQIRVKGTVYIAKWSAKVA